MKKIIKLLLILPFFTIFGCSEDQVSVSNNYQNYGFGLRNIVNKVVDTDPVYKLPVFRAIATNEAITINFEIDMDAVDNTYLTNDFTYTGVVTIPAGEKVGYADISFNPSNLVLGVERKVNFILTYPNDDSSLLNKDALKSSITYSPKCNFNEVQFSMTQDRYGAETTWNIVKDGSVVASGGPFTNLSSDITAVLPVRTLCLEPGNYTLNVFDSYGDGMVTSATVKGSYSLTKVDDNHVLASGDGEFTFSISHDFTLN